MAQERIAGVAERDVRSGEIVNMPSVTLIRIFPWMQETPKATKEKCEARRVAERKASPQLNRVALTKVKEGENLDGES